VELGRAVRGRHGIAPARYRELANLVRDASMRLKINTVVTALNAGEDMSEMILALRPERWKVLQVLPVEGQNSGKVEPLLCSDADFSGFVRRHRHLEDRGIAVVPEDNDDMRGSYAMVDPAGRFFDNVQGGYRYTTPILQAGVDAAWADVSFSMGRFRNRGGDYDFRGVMHPAA
jgi:radical S-adenosyl methionine domain-containing protein 2